MIDSKNYVKYVLRTESSDFNEIKDRLNNDETIRLLHAAMGLVTEAAEVTDMLKKHIFYGKDIDYVNAQEECGDVCWYVAIVIDVLKTTMDDILSKNITKLKKRYPEKFTKEHAINRNIDDELSIFHQQDHENSEGIDWLVR